MAINYMLNENVMTLHLIVEIIKKIFLYKNESLSTLLS